MVVRSPRVAALRDGVDLPGDLDGPVVRRRLWPWGWAVGVVLLLMAAPSKAEKKGYHDF